MIENSIQVITIVEQELVCSETKKGASISSKSTFNLCQGQCPLYREDRYMWDGPLIKAPQYIDAHL